MRKREEIVIGVKAGTAGRDGEGKGAKRSDDKTESLGGKRKKKEEGEGVERGNRK